MTKEEFRNNLRGTCCVAITFLIAVTCIALPIGIVLFLFKNI